MTARQAQAAMFAALRNGYVEHARRLHTRLCQMEAAQAASKPLRAPREVERPATRPS